MELMQKMNEQQCKKLEEKVAEQLNTVKSELTVAISKVSDRQDSMEEDQKEMRSTMSAMQEQLDSLTREKTVSDRSKQAGPLTYAAAAAQLPPGTSSPHLPRKDPVNGEAGGSMDPEVAEIIDRARRTVGLSRIDSDDLIRMRQVQFGGATNEEEEKLLAVKEYLKCELKIRSEDIEKMEIENIFVPAKERDDPKSLNVTFKQLSSVSRVYEKTRIMRKESRISNYIPRQFNDALRAISAIDYTLREDKKYQTRIKMGLRGLELHKKLRGSKQWEKVSLPGNIPPVDLSSRPVASESTSPPPGRPRLESSRDKRVRDSTGSETDQSQPKAAKKDDEKEDTIENLEGKSSQTVEQGDDPGNFTSIEGTPAKTLSMNFALNSPILSRKSIKL